MLQGLMNLGRGSIHLFKSDAGAGSIAGIDLSQGGDVILSLFAVMGLQQILLGVLDLAVGLRYRAFVPLLCAYHFLHQLAAALILWWWRPLPVAAPGKFGALFVIPIVALALWSATRRRPAAKGTAA